MPRGCGVGLRCSLAGCCPSGYRHGFTHVSRAARASTPPCTCAYACCGASASASGPVSRAFHAHLVHPSPTYLLTRAEARIKLHPPTQRLTRRPTRWHPQPSRWRPKPFNAHVNPLGGGLGAPPALPPSGLTLHLMGPQHHPSGPATTLHAVELRRHGTGVNIRLTPKLV